MSARDGAIKGADERGRSADERARRRSPAPAIADNGIRLGVVTAVGTGVCSVGLTGASGSQTEELHGVAMWGATGLLVGDKVCVAWIGPRKVPVILSSAGGGGGTGAPMVTACLLANGE